ncbi:hypothetical protein SAMN05444920_115206 [Nonomuraea solani]|uniref:Uncharacterized protein n=1 Tax=Nonomuraea solani TaxID=1144553 RepID=A0A1H6EQT9_9ACTN|nr:hypothetical protein [Nonomuraea solani]SEH00227.1 hypothetical protein SAMN05444920_115206 [Nonomuraea solani]
MTDDLETYLRSTLGHASEHAPHAPAGLPGRIVARSRRRRTRLHAMIAGVAVASIAVPLTLTRPAGTGDGVTTATTAGPGRVHERNLEVRPPIGERLVTADPSENRPIELWFTRAASGAVHFCTRTRSRAGGGSSFCADDPVAGDFSLQGSTASWPPPDMVLYYGASGDGVSAVAAVTAKGVRTPGTIQRPAGAPQAIWTVTVPSADEVASFEFTDPRGEVRATVRNERLVVPESTAEPVAKERKLGDGLSAGLYETPGKTLIWKLDGKPVETHLVREKDLMTDLGGDRHPVELRERNGRWFGITGARTARVELVFPGGETVSARAVQNPWDLGFRLFAGTHDRTGDIYLEGFEIVGYDAAGKEIWRKPQKSGD